MPRRPQDVWLPMLAIHAAFMASAILYGVIAYLLSDAGAGAKGGGDRALVLGVLGGAAAIAAIASFVVRARVMPARRRGGAPAPISLEQLTAAPAAGAVARLRSALVVGWALCEGVALLGLVAAFWFRDAALYAPFGAGTLGLLLAQAPRPYLLTEVVAALPR